MGDYFLEHQGALVHSTAILGKEVKLGDGVIVGPWALILGDTEVGSGTHISAHSVIGTAAEKHGYFDKTGSITIGKNCIIREYVTINAGTFRETLVGNDCILLRGSHVGHDSILENKVTLSCNSLIGGESFLMEGVNFGLGAVCHQRSLIGSYCIIGMNSTVTKKTEAKPFTKLVGSPAKIIGVNEVAVQRAGLTHDQKAKMLVAYTDIGKLMNDARVQNESTRSQNSEN